MLVNETKRICYWCRKTPCLSFYRSYFFPEVRRRLPTTVNGTEMVESVKTFMVCPDMEVLQQNTCDCVDISHDTTNQRQ